MTTTNFTVYPLRFTDDAPAMVDFLTTLGLSRLVTTEGDGFAVLQGRSGLVMVHATQTADSPVGGGRTTLNFAVPDTVAAADELSALGLETRVWDESYGKQGVVRDPLGYWIGLNGDAEDDLYGYRAHDPAVSSLDVVAVWPSTDFVRDLDYLAAFGLAGTITNPYWCGLRSASRSGVLGLHSADADPAPGASRPDDPLGPARLVALGFETNEPLADLHSRLTGLGIDARLVTDDAPHVSVVDPDGVEIQIHSPS